MNLEMTPDNIIAVLIGILLIIIIIKFVAGVLKTLSILVIVALIGVKLYTSVPEVRTQVDSAVEKVQEQDAVNGLKDVIKYKDGKQ